MRGVTKKLCPPRYFSRSSASRTVSVIERRHVGAHRHAVDRRRGDEAHFADAGERQLQRARDRRGRKRQHVHVGAQVLQALFVLHAEMLLLVDDHQAEIART